MIVTHVAGSARPSAQPQPLPTNLPPAPPIERAPRAPLSGVIVARYDDASGPDWVDLKVRGRNLFRGIDGIEPSLYPSRVTGSFEAAVSAAQSIASNYSSMSVASDGPAAVGVIQGRKGVWYLAPLMSKEHVLGMLREEPEQVSGATVEPWDGPEAYIPVRAEHPRLKALVGSELWVDFRTPPSA